MHSGHTFKKGLEACARMMHCLTEYVLRFGELWAWQSNLARLGLQ